MPIGSTPAAKQAKRNGVYALKREAVTKMHASAADHERRAAELGRMIAVMQAEQISAMLEAALLRAKARESP